MSVNLQRAGSLETPETTLLTTTNATTIHTASSKFLRVIETIVIVNFDVNASEITLSWVDATPTSTIFYFADIPSKSTVIIDNIPMMTSGIGIVRSITATAEVANELNVTVITSAHQRLDRAG